MLILYALLCFYLVLIRYLFIKCKCVKPSIENGIVIFLTYASILEFFPFLGISLSTLTIWVTGISIFVFSP